MERKLIPILLFLILATGLGCGIAHETRQARTEVRLGVGSASHMVYLPVTLARQLGYYEQEGLNIQLEDFSGGAKSLEALMGGSVDVVSGYYDHTVQMAAAGRPLRAFVTMLRYPGLVLAVSPGASRKIDRIEDLKGGIVGVTAPGSSSHFLVNYLLARRGLAPEQVSVLGISAGATAIAAMERGKVDAGVLTDPTFTLLGKRHPGLRVLADTRNAEGVQAVYGVAAYPASVLYAKEEWIRANPETARRLARAIHRVLRWIQEHSAEEIAAQMPAEFQAGDAASYVEALKSCRAMFSPDGLMPAEGPEAVRRVLGQSLEKVREAQIDLGKTYTNEFVQ